MIRLLVKLGRWLDSRFPAKVLVLEKDYQELVYDVSMCMEKIDRVLDLNQRLGDLEAKLEAVQKAAVHKDAVRDVIAVVATLKADLQSFKVSLGMNRMAQGQDILASLNGEPIGEDPNNG
jgi:hypothetical protein